MFCETLKCDELMSIEEENDDALEEGISVVLERKLEQYLASHGRGEIPPGLYDRVLNEVERTVFNITLKYCGGNQSKASKALGINRNTLRKKMQKLNIDGVDH